MFTCFKQIFCIQRSTDDVHFYQKGFGNIANDRSCTGVLEIPVVTQNIYTPQSVLRAPAADIRSYSPDSLLSNNDGLVWTLEDHKKGVFLLRECDSRAPNHTDSHDSCTPCSTPKYGWLFGTMNQKPVSLFKSTDCDSAKIAQLVQSTTNTLEDLYNRIGVSNRKTKPPRSGIPGTEFSFREVTYKSTVQSERIRMGRSSLTTLPAKKVVPGRPRIRMGVASLKEGHRKFDAYDMMVEEEKRAIRREVGVAIFFEKKLESRMAGVLEHLFFCFVLLVSFINASAILQLLRYPTKTQKCQIKHMA